MKSKNLLLLSLLLLASTSVLAQASSDMPSVGLPNESLNIHLHDRLPMSSTPRVAQIALPGTASTTKHGLSALPVTTHEKFATFLAGDFTSVLLLENLRPDMPITFVPSLIVSSGETVLDPITLPAHSTGTLDINAALSARGLSDVRGTVAVRFDFNSYAPGAAIVQMRDDKHHVFLNSYAQSPEAYWTGTDYDAVVWSPQQGTQGFISITNSSNETHSVDLSFLINGKSEQQPQLEIRPRQTQIVSIDDLLARSHKSGAGIHVNYRQGADEEYTGAILVEGQLFNKRTGLAKRIHFVDKELQIPTGTLRTHFLLLGPQPASDNFPANISFSSVAAVRNIDGVPVSVTPSVKFLQNGLLRTVSLPPISLSPGESRTIDFNEEQNAGRLPSDFHQGSVDLTPNTDTTSIVAELFNFSSAGGYVVGPTFSTYPTRSTGSLWRIDGTFQTTIIVENTASQDDQVAVALYSDQGTYKKTFNVAAGNLVKVNVRDLQQNGIPDDKGNLLVGTAGVLSLVGSHNTKSKLVYDKIIHSTDESDYVGYPATECDFVSGIEMFAGSISGAGTLQVMNAYYWTISGEDDEPGGAAVSDPSLAQVNGSIVTFTPPNDGQVHSVTLSPSPSQDDVTFCVACSAGMVFVGGIFGFQFELATTKSQTDFTNPGTNKPFGGDGSVNCFVNAYCTPATLPPACNPSFVIQSPAFAGGTTSCRNFYLTTWLAERFTGDTFWNCFPVLPGENALGTVDPSLGVCTKQ